MFRNRSCFGRATLLMTVWIQKSTESKCFETRLCTPSFSHTHFSFAHFLESLDPYGFLLGFNSTRSIITVQYIRAGETDKAPPYDERQNPIGKRESIRSSQSRNHFRPYTIYRSERNRRMREESTSD